MFESRFCRNNYCIDKKTNILDSSYALWKRLNHMEETKINIKFFFLVNGYISNMHARRSSGYLSICWNIEREKKQIYITRKHTNDYTSYQLQIAPCIIPKWNYTYCQYTDHKIMNQVQLSPIQDFRV